MVPVKRSLSSLCLPLENVKQLILTFLRKRDFLRPTKDRMKNDAGNNNSYSGKNPQSKQKLIFQQARFQVFSWWCHSLMGHEKSPSFLKEKVKRA